MEFFQKLGSLTTRLWKERTYNEEDFQAAAPRALCELPPDRYVTFADVTKWALTCERLPGQAAATMLTSVEQIIRESRSSLISSPRLSKRPSHVTTAPDAVTCGCTSRCDSFVVWNAR